MPTVRLVESPATHRAAIASLLETADEEFVPPLTADRRQSVSRTDATGGTATIEGYVERCLARPLVGAFDGDDLVGICSFHELVEAPPLSGYLPSNHVSILIVDPDYRGRGLGTRLYRMLLSDLPATNRRPNVSTKTWSTNDPHIAVLERLAFDCVSRIPDDRAPGVDTVYYARPTSTTDD